MKQQRKRRLSKREKIFFQLGVNLALRVMKDMRGKMELSGIISIVDQIETKIIMDIDGLTDDDSRKRVSEVLDKHFAEAVAVQGELMEAFEFLRGKDTRPVEERN